MIFYGVSYSAYTFRYGSYCRYEIAPSSHFFLPFTIFYSTCALVGTYVSLCFPQCSAINIIRFCTSSPPRLLSSPLARVHQHTSVLELEVRKENEAVPEGNGPVPQQERGSGEPTLADVY